MQGIKKPAKRSILGTRVSAPWSDGRFYSGAIESVTEQPNGQCLYSILFDDGYSKSFFDEDVVGPGFRSVSGVHLKHGQRVFVTHQSREVPGKVIKHNRRTNCVAIELETSGAEPVEVLTKLDDVRLLESRKSARLQIENDGDQNSRNRIGKKGGTEGIDVPTNRANVRRRKHIEISEEVDMDARMAAMALQNLSCSPASPNFPLDLSKSPQSWNETTMFRPSPSPPNSHYSCSAPSHGFYGSASTDEGIDVDDSMYSHVDEFHQKKRKTEEPSPTQRIMYKCTWRGCTEKMADCKSIEAHIRQAHLGPKEDLDLSDHEEEFYYEEVEELELEDMTLNFTNMHCTSPIQPSPLNLSLHKDPISHLAFSPGPVGVDHDYQRKETGPTVVHTSPILIPGASPPQITHFFPQNSPYSRLTHKGSPVSPTATTSSPKHTGVRKSRSDVKKCRKVYGMEKRDLWCTQCKWKKACTRFINE